MEASPLRHLAYDVRGPDDRLERRRWALPTVRWELGVSCFATNPKSAVIDGRWRNLSHDRKSVAGVLNFRALSPPKKRCACENKIRIKPMGIRKMAILNAMQVG